MASRRGFLATLFAATTAPALSWADAGSPSFIAAAKEKDGSFALYGLRDDGLDAFRVALPARGHAGAAHPTRPEAVAFARRPGAFALVIDCLEGRLLATLSPPEGQYFNGHGTFSADGSVLYTVENIAATSEGVLGLWSRNDDWARIGQVPTGGLGPHDILRLAGSDVLVVANGGLVTATVTGDETGNIPTMRPSLAYLGHDGTLLEQVELPDLRRNSIRHLAQRPDGLVAFAMQWQGDPAPEAPLLGLHLRGKAPVLLAAPAEEQALMQGYIGSVALDHAGDRVAISSSKGGRLHLFSVAEEAEASRFIAAFPRGDVSGLAASAAGMIATDGFGGVLSVAGDALSPLARAPRAWDNHIVAL